jgi:hypothetical protein
MQWQTDKKQIGHLLLEFDLVTSAQIARYTHHHRGFHLKIACEFGLSALR